MTLLNGSLGILPKYIEEFDFRQKNCSYWETSMDSGTGVWRVKPATEVALKITMVSLMLVIGIPANLSIIWILVRNRLLRLQPINLFILSMALSDALNLAIIPVLYLFRQENIFRFFLLGPVICHLRPILTIWLALTGALTLTAITMQRFLGIVLPNRKCLELNTCKSVAIITLIWLAALASALPTLRYRRYSIWYFVDLTAYNCNDDTFHREDEYYRFYFVIISLSAFIPTLVLAVTYATIIFRLTQSMKNTFPYLSQQSMAAKSRKRLTKMLFALLLIQLICCAPWPLFTILDSYGYHQVVDHNNEDPIPDLIITVLLHMKYYFSFLNSALNPFIYGYGSESMRKAFQLTFPCFQKTKPNFVLKRNGAGVGIKFYFEKVKNQLTNGGSHNGSITK